MAHVPLYSSQMVELKTMAVEAVPVEMMVKLEAAELAAEMQAM